MKKRIFYFDALRALAIICVVVLHATAMLRFSMPSNMTQVIRSDVLIEAICNNSFRIGVDLFLVLSGALSLGREWEIKEFLSKRLVRITKPFIFWATFTSILLIIFSYCFTQVHYVTAFDPISLIHYVLDTYLAKASGSTPYWFFWMILGTYLIMPIFNKWLLHSDLKEAEYFLVIWLFVSLVEETLGYTSPIKLSYFTSPIGLVVLGYYLRYTKREFLNNKKIAIFLILFSAATMLICSYAFPEDNFFKTFSRYSILNIIEVIGIVCLFKTSKLLENPNNILKRITQALARTSYGLYLVHCQIMIILVRFLPLDKLGYTIEFLTLILGSLIISYILVTIVSKIPLLEEYAGSK